MADSNLNYFITIRTILNFKKYTTTILRQPKAKNIAIEKG